MSFEPISIVASTFASSSPPTFVAVAPAFHLATSFIMLTLHKE